MGNFCGTSGRAPAAEPSKDRAFAVTVRKAHGATGNSQAAFLQSSLPTRFPNATLTVLNVANADPDFFEVLVDDVVVYSSQKMGQIQTAMDALIRNITAALEQPKQT